jgi:integrase
MTVPLSLVCAQAKVDLAPLGQLGAELSAVVDMVGAVARERASAVLADPSFALELVRAPWSPGRRPTNAVIGGVLDDLRTRAGLAETIVRFTSVTDAAADWEARGLALCAPGTMASYRPWVRRLVAVHGDDDVCSVDAVKLAKLIAGYTRGRGPSRGSQSGRSAEETAVSAYRHFWSHLVATGVVVINPARQLRKPARFDAHRRPIHPDEAALIRQFARISHDPLLDEVAICLTERLGLRPIELAGLRPCDIDIADATLGVTGKGGKRRWLPIPPRLLDLVDGYAHSRRAGSSTEEWWASTTCFLQRRPTPDRLTGDPVGRVWLDDLFPRLSRGMPPTPRPVSLYSYRHAIATWIDPRYGRAMTRRILGHTFNSTPTEAYVHVDEDELRAAVGAYEGHLLEDLGS